MTEFNELEDLERLDFSIGSIYFNEHYVITNFKEGINIDYQSYKEVGLFIKSYYNGKDFGYMANRENSYSINLKDASFFNDAFPNPKAYAFVVYNTFTERIFEIEYHFFPQNRQTFKVLNEAIDWVRFKLK